MTRPYLWDRTGEQEIEIRATQFFKACGLDLPDRPGPCWCNGPWRLEKQHHEHCRLRRRIWKRALRLLHQLKPEASKIWP